MTVIPFPTLVQQQPPRQPSYGIAVFENGDGFDWQVIEGETGAPSNDRVASDLAAIALSLRPPPRTFLQRLRYLFQGEPE